MVARVLVVGSGAREHALAWRIAGEGATVICTPGNPLMAAVGSVRPDVGLSDLDALVSLAEAEKIDLVVVGPEAPLVDGLADRLRAVGIACFGPSADAAEIEGSKSFARDVCRAAGVPVARGQSFESVEAALEHAELLGLPVVVKADGLAAGKGVAICATLGEAEAHARGVIEAGRFGEGPRKVVVEEFLAGAEASVIALCDGIDAVLLPAARDHKRLLDGNLGRNTGGMGAYSPVEELDASALESLRRQVFLPVLTEMAIRGVPFRGALFAGLMLTARGVRVLEFNARLGDPETQAMLPRLDEPLLPLLEAAAVGSLAAHAPLVRVRDEATVALTLAAAGYPDTPRRGDTITGIDAARAMGVLVFGGGVAGHLETAGGRVLTVVGRGEGVAAAADAAYAAADRILFEGKVIRTDIGRASALAGAGA